MMQLKKSISEILTRICYVKPSIDETNVYSGKINHKEDKIVFRFPMRL